jgi:adenylate cyclase
MPGSEQRRLAAIMFTDMVGYSALAQRNEALALDLLEEQRGIVRGLLPAHVGREVKTTGDGFLIEFPSALAAVQCAVAVQQALHERNQAQPPERQVRIRIGIHVGDVVHRDGDIHGDGVNIAARLEPLAQPGGICVSEDVVRQIRNKLPHALASLGPAELKNIELPIVVHRVVLPWQPQVPSAAKPPLPAPSGPGARAWVVGLVVTAALAATAWWLWHRRPAVSPESSRAGRINSLAVKPLDDFSGDTNQAYLSDGMTEALCAALGNVSALRVPGRSSVMRYKGGQKTIREMATELNVEAIVEGSVQRTASNLLVSVQLIEAASDRHLWATNYRRDLSDFFKVQNEVAQAIAAEIQVRLSPREQALLAQAAQVSPLVLEAYLKGRFHLARATQESFEQSLVSFEEALRLDPKFAKAYSGIADAYVLAMGWFVDDAVGMELGFKAATNAVALDPAAAEPLASLGWFYTLSGRWTEAEAAFEKSLDLNPRYARALNGEGWLKIYTGKSDAGLNLIIQAQELDPGAPVLAADVAWAGIDLGRYELAATYLDKATRLEREFWLAQELRGVLLALQGNYAEAIPWADKAVQNSGRNVEALATLGWIHGKAGDSAGAREILAELLATTQPRAPAPVHLCWVYAGLNQPEDAIRQLREAARVRDPGLFFLRVDRRFDSLRRDPRFREILETIEPAP